MPAIVLHEPWTVETGQGGFYRVFTPFWRAVRDRDVAAPAGRARPCWRRRTSGPPPTGWRTGGWARR